MPPVSWVTIFSFFFIILPRGSGGWGEGTEIEGDSVDVDAEVGEMLVGVLVFMGNVQEGLGRDATDVEAGSTEGSSLFDAGGLEAELGSFNSGDITFGVL